MDVVCFKVLLPPNKILLISSSKQVMGNAADAGFSMAKVSFGLVCVFTWRTDHKLKNLWRSLNFLMKCFLFFYKQVCLCQLLQHFFLHEKPLSSPFSIGFNHTVSKLMHLLITRNKIFGKICVDGKDLIFYDHLTCFQTSGDSIKKVRNKIKARRRQKKCHLWK